MSFKPLYTEAELARTRRQDAVLIQRLGLVGEVGVVIIVAALIASLFLGGGPLVGLIVLMVLAGVVLTRALEYGFARWDEYRERTR